MRILVTHDAAGNILSLAVPAPDAPGQLVVEPQAGELVSELDVPSVDQEQLHELSGIARDSRIDLASGRPKLVRKSKD
jgi:hypothetical protein